VNEPEIAPREHEESDRCWCKPMLVEPCLQCNPFDDIADESKRDKAIVSALAVKLSVPGVTAKRPKKSEGCWKCGGEGVFFLTEKQAAKPKIEGRSRFVLHRNVAAG
jgi:hypothetical protein